MGRAALAILRSKPRRHDICAKAGEGNWPVLRLQHERLRPVALWPGAETARGPGFSTLKASNAGGFNQTPR
jgi:hypothetical protein